MENPILLEDIQNILDDTSIKWSDLCNKSILITGATGLVGSLIVKTLLQFSKSSNQNLTIIAHVRSKEKSSIVFKDWLENSSLRILDCSFDQLQNQISNLHYIIHTAAPTSSLEFIEKPVEVIDFIFSSTHSLLKLSVEKNIESMIFLSSVEVYGETDEKAISESDFGSIDPCSVRSSYPEAKRVAETLCCSYASEYGVPVKIARLTQCFGAGVNINSDDRVFSQFIKSIIKKEDLILHTSGKSAKCYIYTSDAIKALLFILLAEKSSDTYNVANDSTYISIYNMAYSLATKYNLGLQVHDNHDINKKYMKTLFLQLDTSKLKALGWKAEYDLLSMYERMLAYIENQK